MDNVQKEKLEQDITLVQSPRGSQDMLGNVENGKITFRTFSFFFVKQMVWLALTGFQR